MKTIFYLSQNTQLLLERSNITLWFPEAHQHPVELDRDAGQILGHVVATHSEALINLTGHKIADGSFTNDMFEVRILWEDGTVQVCTYDTEGYLQNWPIGFFNLPL